MYHSVQLVSEESDWLHTSSKDHLNGVIHVRQTTPRPIDLLFCKLDVEVDKSIRSALSFRSPTVWKVKTNVQLFASHYDASSLSESLSLAAESMRDQIDKWRRHHLADGHPLPCIYITHKFSFHTGEENVGFGELLTDRKNGKPEEGNKFHFSEPSVIKNWVFNLEHQRIDRLPSKTTEQLQEQLKLMFQVTAKDHQRFHLVADCSSLDREHRKFTLQCYKCQVLKSSEGLERLARVSKLGNARMDMVRNAVDQWNLQVIELPSRDDKQQVAGALLLRFFKLSQLDRHGPGNKVFLCPSPMGPGLYPLSQALNISGDLKTQANTLSQTFEDICTAAVTVESAGRSMYQVVVLTQKNASI